jgi:NTE family protein
MLQQDRKRVGLALGGGVVRGIAHIGVLDVLEEAGILVDYIAGSSAGALIGATYCAGVTPAHLRQSARRLNWFKWLRPVWPVRGFFSFRKMEDWLIEQMGDVNFNDLHIPFAVVATDMNDGDMVVLDRGRVAPAVVASCSVAGVIAPSEIDGRLLCDGNFSNSVPVGVVRAMGAEYVIGVDIFMPTVRRWMGALGYLLAGAEILIQSAGGGIRAADCLVAPDLAGMSYIRFSQAEKLYTLGAQAARKKLPEIRHALGME